MSIALTYGALLLGCFIAVALSGIVTVQTYVYYKVYPTDQPRIKCLVAFVWFLDFLHTNFICAAVWHFLISDFGKPESIKVIPWTIALSIATTAVLTLCVHFFFAHRIFMFSKRNWFITGPILVIAVLRLCAASTTTGALLHYHNFTDFKKKFRWVFTLGLSLSSGVDVIITAALCYFLKTTRTESSRLNRVIDSLILYTFETGSLTCIATISSMIFWLAAPSNLIFMGLHFGIGKLYANSLLVTLNTRKQLRRGRSVKGPADGETILPVTFLGGPGGGDSHKRGPDNYSQHYKQPSMGSQSHKVQITVQKTIQEDLDSDSVKDEIKADPTHTEFAGV
jgi:hypothetical protein